jgi:serine/threonine-protein kinase
MHRVGSAASDVRGTAPLPTDLQEQVRGRVRLLALFILFAFGLDCVVYAGHLVAAMFGVEVPPERLGTGVRIGINLGAVAMSAWLWLAARSPAVSASRLHTLGLVYQVVICFTIATLTTWQYFADHGLVPNLTWVPVIVVLFPLILPGSPRRMLLAACAAGAMSPVALAVLELAGAITTDADAYIQATVGSTFAVAFAYLGARIVYGLGREVAAAREMGSYLLEEKLGQGGMGEVWRARHRLLARPAAIKLIRPVLAGGPRTAIADESRRRFEREAQATARLSSPHTVQLFDFGVAADDSFYYVMELLDGLDADTLVRRFGPLPAERAIHLLRQVCHSLSEAESFGLVHRDIKPANVFVCRYGGDGDFVKVLDFGLVKALGDGAETAPSLTRESVLAGTPAFMAPEQAIGRHDLDGRADIYATGCVAYWLLTGQHVFTADGPIGMIMHHTQTSPAPPSARVELPIPLALDALVLSCLAKAPADRPQTARELSRRLAAIDLQDAWTDELARSWWDAHVPSTKWVNG